FLEKKYFNTGYPFLVDSNGDFLVSPKNAEENTVDTAFFRKMKNMNTDLGEFEYECEEKEKRLYFSYVKSYDAYVVVSIYTNELLGEVKSARNFIIMALISALSLIILVTSLIMNSISKDLKNSVRFAEQVASGDLSQTMNINKEDEIGQLAKALNTMTTNLKDIVSNIIQGSENIALASQQLSSTSVHLSQSANEQASSVEEISSTLEEISANIQQNTENASQTEKVSSEANEEIKNVSSKSNQAVNANKEIANKITIINDIAFQTNLLALNAAVEAARAGAHGKGFAVVASEVRKLAEKSKLAADEIVRLATTGLKVSEAAGEVMQGIIPKVENTSKLIQEISASSVEQNSGASQVNNAIQQLNIVTQQNAAASEELATSAEEMNIQAQQLKDTISFFKVESNNSPKTNLIVKTSQSLSTLSDVSKETTELIPEEQNEHDFENF
ncbi:MAG: methyl-accepting chemotaxis protein, partial [Bacteroidales bacterium]|nr:methyl-accepting chemotaxis protein [Bacteroidales bacterium]